MEIKTLLDGDNFYIEIYKLGYDRYRFDGRGLGVSCLLWKINETSASIDYEAPTLLTAAAGAIHEAKRIEAVKTNDVLSYIKYA